MARTMDALLGAGRPFPPPEAFAEHANVTADRLGRLRRRAASDPDGFWADVGRRLDWDTPFTTVLDARLAPHYRWYADGRLNAAVNCLDRHLPARGDQIAIIAEREDGRVRRLTYAQLHAEVCRFSAALGTLGVSRGDRVVIYMPMVAEVAVAMLACARIGATHSVVFGGFSAASLRDRIEDCGARVLVTADGGMRGGKVVPLKANADEAMAGTGIKTAVVLRVLGSEVPMQDGRDVWWHDAVADAPDSAPAVAVEAEHPLFILYTSGSTGKPKGVVQCTGGYLAWADATCDWVFDLRDGDVYWCTADVGWVTGHTYVVYGPLLRGATVVMYEGAPMHPGPDRFWDIVERHGVSVFYTAPTAIRALRRAGDDWPARHDLSSLRLLGTVGEPINPDAWLWYHATIGGGRCPIVDTWWQTETGGILMSPLPGATPAKPGSCSGPLPGIEAAIVDERGQPVPEGQGGWLVIRKPWPAMLRTLWGDDARYANTYWGRFGGGLYVAGDTAHQDSDGDYWILGRGDDVLNVSGHRLGTMEIESALVSHPAVAEAAVVGFPHEVKGEAVCAFVVLRSGTAGSDLAKALRDHVGKAIGAIAKPEQIRFADGLPKTRSGKIMRRILRAIARGEAPEGDTSTLENPAVVEQLQQAH